MTTPFEATELLREAEADLYKAQRRVDALRELVRLTMADLPDLRLGALEALNALEHILEREAVATGNSTTAACYRHSARIVREHWPNGVPRR